MEQKAPDLIVSHTGLELYGWDFSRDGNLKWSLGGGIRKEYRFREYNSYYDIEEMLIEKVGKVDGMDPDSESGMLCIYFKDKESAVAYLKKAEEYLDNVRSLA
jgi:hypothetical protein